MATYTLYEYDTVTPAGDPVRPATIRTTGLAFGAAQRLAQSTVFFQAIPDADAYLRVSSDGSAATSADEKIFAGVGGDGHIRLLDRPYVHLIAA